MRLRHLLELEANPPHPKHQDIDFGVRALPKCRTNSRDGRFGDQLSRGKVDAELSRRAHLGRDVGFDESPPTGEVDHVDIPSMPVEEEPCREIDAESQTAGVNGPSRSHRRTLAQVRAGCPAGLFGA